MTKPDLTAVDAMIRETAAAEIMPRFRKLAAGDVEMKGVDDPVTIADKESERVLTERFTAYMPGSVVVGEESFARDKAIMAHVDSDAPVWVIDPIDGTRNFVAGKPEFAVMVALVKNRVPVASWIHDPNSGDTIMAEQGGGVWLRGKKLKLAAATEPMVGLVGARVKKLVTDPTLVAPQPDKVQFQIGSCAGFDYPRLFEGEVSFANVTLPRAGFLLYRHTNAWDHVPGMFLHKEAGGYHADWAGNAYDMTKPRAGLLYAPDKEHWTRLHRVFQPLIQHAMQRAPA